MILKSFLSRDDRGIGAVEFALVAPVLIAFIVGVSQIGRMFYANADMKNAIAHGARVASVYSETEIPDSTIIAAVNNRLMREGASARATTTVFRGTENGNRYLELRVTYSVPLEFIFFDTPPVTLKDTRKVFIPETLANQTTITTTSASSTTSSTTSTSSGTTSATSSGTTSATSSGTTSSTSASSSGTSSTTSASSSGNNGSSGNGNGSSGNNNGSSGHAHGDCKNHC